MLDDFDTVCPKTPTKLRSAVAPKTPKTPKTPSRGDRFIPTRSAMDLGLSSFHVSKENDNPQNGMVDSAFSSPSRKNLYQTSLDDAIFEGKMKDHKILAFKNKAPAPREHDNPHKVLYSCNKANTAAVKKSTRHIPQNPEKILDAPGLADDYYLNLIDWSAQNVVAIGLANTVFLWNAASGSITELMKTEDESNPITSVQWTKQGGHLAVGTNAGVVQLWDVANQKALRMMRGHGARVGALAWNEHILSSGSKDGSIHNHDVRIQHHHIATLANHTQEVCGLKWSDDGLQLASGGNDNLVNIWDVSQTSPKFTFTEHQAAVKALAWCPWQRDLLATGGGTADRCIRFWNTSTGACLNSIDTGSQVSNLMWSKNSATKEIVSSHGFSQNQLVVWKYPSLVRVAELRGHEQRILSLAGSPDGTTVCSAAADETLRFWKVFDPVVSASAKSQIGVPVSSKQGAVASTKMASIHIR